MGYSTGDSGTYRLIQSVCKCVKTHACEKSGRISFLTEEYGFCSVPFITFKGNRFNVLFYNGGVLFSLFEQLKEFFEVVKDENRLLKCTHYDLHVTSFICGCRGLGLINKFVKRPLWRVLDSDIHIRALNKSC